MHVGFHPPNRLLVAWAQVGLHLCETWGFAHERPSRSWDGQAKGGTGLVEGVLKSRPG
jgi:hypothetical protein